MTERDRARKPRGAKLRTLAGVGCWCGLPFNHKEKHEESSWEKRERLDAESVKRLTDALVRMSLVAGKQGVGIAILCERGIPRYVAPSPEVPLGEVCWYGSRPFREAS